VSDRTAAEVVEAIKQSPMGDSKVVAEVIPVTHGSTPSERVARELETMLKETP
jgi:hypothetical protein